MKLMHRLFLKRKDDINEMEVFLNSFESTKLQRVYYLFAMQENLYVEKMIG